MFNFVRNCQTGFQSGCAVLHCMRVPVVPCPQHYMIMSVFLKSFFFWAYLHIFFRCLLGSLFAHILMGCVFYWVVKVLCSRQKSSQICGLWIFSPILWLAFFSCSLMVSFEKQFLILMKSNLSFFPFIIHAIWILFKKMVTNYGCSIRYLSLHNK